MTLRRQNPLGPALIVGLFLVFLVFLLVSRKGHPGDSHSQSVTQNQ